MADVEINSLTELDIVATKAALSSSSTALRLARIHNLEDKLRRHEVKEQNFNSLLDIFFGTYPFYCDRRSRQAIQCCIKIIFSAGAKPEALSTFIKTLQIESTKQGISPSNAFVLVEWFSILIQECCGTAYWQRWGLDLILNDAQVLELCQSTSSKPNLRHSALVVTRRALRKVFSSPDTGAHSLNEAVLKLTSKSSHGLSKNATMLGVIAGVCARRPQAKMMLEAKKPEIYAYYIREIVGSRMVVPPHIANGLHDFFYNFATSEDVENQLSPSLEKGLLRAPEIVLDDLLTPLFESLPDWRIDLSNVLCNNLMKPLLNCIKSSNPTIRQGAISAFKTGIIRCHDEESVQRISDEILNPLKSNKVAAAEQKALYFEMLASLPISATLAGIIMPAVTAIAAKEASEVALSAETSVLTKYAVWCVSKAIGIEESVINAFAKGITDKKVPIRRLWAIRLGEILWSIDDRELEELCASKTIETILPNLLDLWNEIISNPLAAAQSGLVVAAYILTATAPRLLQMRNTKIDNLLKKALVMQHALGFEAKASFLLNHRIYSKLVNEDDFAWFARALMEVSRDVTKVDPGNPASVAWSQAIIFCISSKSVIAGVRRQTIKALSKAYIHQPVKIAEIITKGLWRWVRSIDAGEKDGATAAAKNDNSSLHLVVKAICLPSTEARSLGVEVDHLSREQQMVSMLCISRPELLPHVSWIELCLRVEVDPGSLSKKHSSALINQIIEITSFNAAPSLSVQNAAFNAAAELAFVAPDVMTPQIIELIQQDLDPRQLDSIGPTEAAIFRTPDGTTFVDVLAKKSQVYTADKKMKDYETLKWETELRAQLALKKGQQMKLTAEENAKVSAQLAKEAGIRLQIQHLETRLLRGIGIIRSLATGPPTEAKVWIGPAVKALLEIITAGAGLIIGDVAATSYILCAEGVSNRVGTLRSYIGVATLRAMDITQLPEPLTQEPIGDLVTRVLYRLRFSGEQRPFDIVSLIYILPLVLLVLRNRGFGGKDDSEAQVVLALEFLAFHTEVFSDVLLPREEVLSALILSMQTYNQHFKMIKDCLTDLCRCIAPNITQGEVAILAGGTIVPQVSVRTSVLQCISAEVDMSELNFSEEVWLSCHDDVDENIDLGREIWEESRFKISAKDVFKILPYLNSHDKQLRRAAARALAQAVMLHKSTFDDVIYSLEESYLKLSKPKTSQVDEYGMPKKIDLSDSWEERNGIALAFRELSNVFREDLLNSFLKFLIEQGPLGDRNPYVREEMLEAAMAIITLHGKNKVEELMNTFEHTLEEPDKGTEFSDRINEAVVIMYGALGQHLKAGDARVPKVVERLLATLSTPSETVQYAIAECLPPLVRASSDKTPGYIQQILDQLFSAGKFAARRGAAYGLAGFVHGKGVVALREYRIMLTLKGGIDNKKDVNHREGALLAYELLSTLLGRIFEPYVIQIVPQLLSSFGDPSADVRDACLAAAKASFARLSSFGVKKILPTLLAGLDDQQWRSKKGACDLLGAMAYLDPQQLAQSLPAIIPPLTAVLNDSHKEVRLAANRSLKRFGEVISNPEIKSLVDILLKALSDPTKWTDDALDALIKVSFVHYLDAPSLALVVRILERGLGDRSATKRKSAKVIGSLAHLTERRDLITHLPILVAGLKIAIVDPVPTTRATASKALGSLIEKLGEEVLPDLIPGLMQTLKSDTGAGDRLGSAQALSEVLAGLGTGRLEETLPTILQNVTSSKSSVREGFMSLFIFLPVCFGNSFANYLSKIIPPILSGLADEVESIRDTSLRAGRLLVKNFATRAIDLLLPELERGLADDNYRIRLSSVELVGDLLFNLTGVNANAELEDVESGAQEAGASLLEVLGKEKRNKILSSLYICRCDTSGLVRTAAVGVWKALVSSPRTLKDLIPTLTQLIIRRLGSSNMEQKVIASNALGELIRKAGDGVLSSLLPTLEEGLQTSTDTDTKQGICIALRELISSASTEALEDHEKTLISVVRAALIDSDEEVREAAAEAFDSLQHIFGKHAVDQVLPHLLGLLRIESEANNALSALLTLLRESTRANIILPNLIPTLTTPPISSFNAKALASLSNVAGSAMTRRLPGILNSLMDSIIFCKNEELRVDLEGSFDTIVLSVDEFDGLNTAMSVLLALVKHDDHRRRATVDYHLANFFAATNIDYSRYNQDIIRTLLISFDDRDPAVVKAAWTALNKFTNKLKKEEMEALVLSTRQVLQQVGVAGADLPGFGLPKGINAILPIFLQGLMNGTTEQRTQSALAISDIVDRTNGESLKPFVTQITGPLIRVISEKSTDLRAAILLTLNSLLEKIPLSLKPFLPQLQRTFAKSLADTSSEVLRTRAAKALGTLITLTPRIDPLIAELVTGSRTSDLGIRNAMLKALYEVISKAGSNMNDTSRTAVLGLIDTDPDDNDVNMAITNARLLGALIKNVPLEISWNIIKNKIMTLDFSPSSVLALNSVLFESPESLIASAFGEELPSVICQGISSKSDFIANNSVLAAGKYLLTPSQKSFEATKPVFEALALSVQPGNPVDKRRLALVVIRTTCRHHMTLVKPHLALLAVPIFSSVRDPVIPIKFAAEAALVALFSVVDQETKVFDKYIATRGNDLPPATKKSMIDYFKRIALRLGNQARERRDAEGGEGGLGLSNDEVEDEREIWSVGKVDLGEGIFAES